MVNRTVPADLVVPGGRIEHDCRHVFEMARASGVNRRSEAADEQADVGLAPFEQFVGREFARVVPRIAAGQIHAERIARLPGQHVVGPRDVARTAAAGARKTASAR